jgi:hypothetical protein
VGQIPGYARLFNARRFMALLGADVVLTERRPDRYRHSQSAI